MINVNKRNKNLNLNQNNNNDINNQYEKNNHKMNGEFIEISELENSIEKQKNKICKNKEELNKINGKNEIIFNKSYNQINDLSLKNIIIE